jgi:hypothetical protein
MFVWATAVNDGPVLHNVEEPRYAQEDTLTLFSPPVIVTDVDAHETDDALLFTVTARFGSVALAAIPLDGNDDMPGACHGGGVGYTAAAHMFFLGHKQLCSC